MKKLLSYVLTIILLLTTYQPSYGQDSSIDQQALAELTQQNKPAYKRFASWMLYQTKVSPKDIRILYRYAYKTYISKQTPTEKESKRALTALKRTGIKIGTLAAVITVIYKGVGWWNWHKEQERRMIEIKRQQEKEEEERVAKTLRDLQESQKKQEEERKKTLTAEQAAAEVSKKFIFAAKKGWYENANKLASMENGPDINMQIDESGNTALHTAAGRGAAGVTELLTNNQIDVNRKNNYNETPLHATMDNWSHKAAIALLDHSADPNIQDIDGNTPLHKVITRWIEISNETINNEDDQKVNDLYKKNATTIINKLLEKGARTDIANNKNQTALDLIPENDAELRALLKM